MITSLFPLIRYDASTPLNSIAKIYIDLYNFVFLVYTAAQARVSVILSTAPPLSEVAVEPIGYTHCYTIESGFYNGIWMTAHRVCEYPQASGIGIWVADYWQCISFQPSGVCTRWHLARSHWASHSDREYLYPGHTLPHDHGVHFEHSPRYSSGWRHYRR